MVPSTRSSDPTPELTHLVTVILGMEAEPTITTLLQNGIDTLEIFMSLDEAFMAKLTYTETVETVVENLPPVITTSVLSLNTLSVLRLQQGLRFLDSVDTELYDEFDMETCQHFNNRQFLSFVKQSRTNPPTVQPPKDADVIITTKVSSNTNDLLKEWKKGIKRDIDHYPVLKEERNWLDWRRHVTTTATTHGIANLLKSDYKPPDDQKDLFTEHNNFLFTVLLKKVQTANGKILVTKFINELNGQKAYASLVQRAEDSPVAYFDATALRNKICTLKLDDTWRGSATTFLNKWETLNEQLDSMSHDPGLITSAVMRKQTLVAAVSQHPQLAAITQAELMDKARGKDVMEYSNYLEVLRITASLHDAENKAQTYPRRTVNSHLRDKQDEGHGHEHEQSENEGEEEYEEEYEEQDEEIKTRQVSGGPTGFSVPLDTWHQLPSAVKKLLYDARENALRNVNTGNQYNSDNNSSPPTPTQVPVATTPVTPMSSDTSFFTQMTHRHDPSDARSVMSQHVKPQRFEVVSINGEQYSRTVNTMKVQYQFSLNNHSEQQKRSQVDRGSNGGWGGSDIKVVRYTGHHVDVIGLDGHTVPKVPIGTAAGYTLLSDGPAILIMHQYAIRGEGETVHSSIQLEAHGLEVDDHSCQLNGHKQCITTPEGYMIPLSIHAGLAYIHMRTPTELEYITLRHIVLTSDGKWDPSIYDDKNGVSTLNENHQVPSNKGHFDNYHFDQHGECKQSTINIRTVDNRITVRPANRVIKIEMPDIPNYGQTSTQVHNISPPKLPDKSYIRDLEENGEMRNPVAVAVNGESFKYGNKQSVITSSTLPHQTPHKRHLALYYHRVRQAVKTGILRFYYKKGRTNPDDVLSKHTGHADAWPNVKPMLFWQGNMMDIPPARGEY